MLDYKMYNISYNCGTNVSDSMQSTTNSYNSNSEWHEIAKMWIWSEKNNIWIVKIRTR